MKLNREYFWELVVKKSFWVIFFAGLIFLTCLIFGWMEIFGIIIFFPITLFVFFESVLGSKELFFSDFFLDSASVLLWLFTIVGVVYVVKKKKYYKSAAVIIICWFTLSAVVWWINVVYWIIQ